MKAPKPHVWRTQQGEVIEVQWMTSLHLVHSFNMVMRNNRFDANAARRRLAMVNDAFSTMYREIDRRGLLHWAASGNSNFDQLRTDGIKRETPAQLAMLRAVLDTEPKASMSVTFQEDPQAYVEHILANPGGYQKEIVLFTQYRLERP